MDKKGFLSEVTTSSYTKENLLGEHEQTDEKMSLNEFIDTVYSGAINDYDGSGALLVEDKFVQNVKPSQLKELITKYKDIENVSVVWYNK